MQFNIGDVRIHVSEDCLFDRSEVLFFRLRTVKRLWVCSEKWRIEPEEVLKSSSSLGLSFLELEERLKRKNKLNFCTFYPFFQYQALFLFNGRVCVYS